MTMNRKSPNVADGFSSHYLPLFWERQRQQWENYTHNTHHDLNTIDSEIFSLVDTHRKLLTENTINTHLMKKIVLREWIEKHPETAALRNKLDDRGHYITGSMPADPQELARNIRLDVIRLMKLRNKLARSLQFETYPDLMLFTEDLSQSGLKSFLCSTLNAYLPEAHAIIKHRNIKWTTWFDHLERMSSSVLHTVDDIHLSLWRKMGFPNDGNIKIISKQQSIHGYAGILNGARDIRILIRPVKTVHGVMVFLHELGHAAAHSMNRSQGLAQLWSAAYDETMAMILQLLGCKILLENEMYQQTLEIGCLETVRCTLSSLFEFKLWRSPENGNDLYKKHFSRLGVDIGDDSLWVLDSFRSIDPVYIYTYVLGTKTARLVLQKLETIYQERYALWGKWLNDRFYADGWLRPLMVKLREAKIDIPQLSGKAEALQHPDRP
ncbi:hypothetical protein JW979_00270 [bacterium]|nr:hypothetical protein [candidate division CSSED10-310 bacterium]